MESVRTKRLLTVKEVAHILHVPESWVYSKSERDELPCIRVGRYVRFDLDAVMASFAGSRNDGR
jgi:excisionase family DNA binding protein